MKQVRLQLLKEVHSKILYHEMKKVRLQLLKQMDSEELLLHQETNKKRKKRGLGRVQR